jgi:chromodomain-helicase-DNA-binding protein 1
MPALSLLNGRLSPLENSTLTNDDAQYDSESDSILSEVANPIVDEPSPAPSRNHQSEFGAQDSESSAAEVQDESDDADFDMEDTPAPTAPHLARQDRSTSAESRRPAKRKLDLEDEHILANPELYGLRRSVRYCRW